MLYNIGLSLSTGAERVLSSPLLAGSGCSRLTVTAKVDFRLQEKQALPVHA